MSIKGRITRAVSLHYVLWFLMFMALVAMTFTAWGAYLVLAEHVTQAAAAFITGGGVVGAMLIVVFIAWLCLRPKNPPIQQLATDDSPERHMSQPEAFIEQQLRPYIGDRATRWVQQNPGLLTVGALSTGVILAASPGLRRTLTLAAKPILIRKGMSALTGGDD